MGAPVGNQFWKARTKHGRNKLFASAELLWEACQEYFQWVEDNPLWSSKTVQFQGQPVDLPEAKLRAMTIGGLCIFLDIERRTWTDWKSDKDFSPIVTRVEEIIYHQKLTGAAADLLNPNIIARELGLRDAVDTKHSGTLGLTDLSDAELTRRLAELEQARANSER
jgi:hypothetical protein